MFLAQTSMITVENGDVSSSLILKAVRSRRTQSPQSSRAQGG
jgi:hypothetical protein